MQTKTRFDPPRNRESYEHRLDAMYLDARNPAWDAMNRAEFWLWTACKKAANCSGCAWSPARTAADLGTLANAKAQARYWLRLAQTQTATTRLPA